MSTAIPQRFADLYDALLVVDAEQSVIHRAPTRALDDKELAYLMGTASRLALETDAKSPLESLGSHYAYEVAVRVPMLNTTASRALAGMSELILSRLGNFPARRLLRERFQEEHNLSRDPYVLVEQLVRESENRFGSNGLGTLLTDFQIRLLTALSRKKFVSVSAPTSAGKSFVLLLDLVRRLKAPTAFVAIFLVPTRALIRQVSLDLLDEIKKHELDVSVMTAPSVPDGGTGVPTKLVYILTQERCAALLVSAPLNLKIDLILVDEAQEIGKPERGQTLERVLRLALAKNQEAQVFFSSPLRSNPEYLTELFSPGGEETENFIEYQAPVTQNMMTLKKVKGKPRQAEAFVLTRKGETSLGPVELGFDFRKTCLGNVAYFFTSPSDTSIVFCNRPSAADAVALQITSNIKEPIEDESLKDFADFLQEEVHRLYGLAKFIRKGVAFHYSNIPQIVRGRIEELVKEKRLRFICCTSTLLQGMNMPAKNIFIENPKSGIGKPMDPGDFWNLVGRAGRLNYEFTGNVFCVYSKDWEADLISENKLVPMESAFERAVNKQTLELAFFCEEPSRSSEVKASMWAEQAIAKIYADHVTRGVLLQDRAGDETYKSAATRVDKFCANFKATRQTLDDQHYEQNLYVHPTRLEALAEVFRNTHKLHEYIPLPPRNAESYSRLRNAFELIEELFVQEGTARHNYFAVLANMWMEGRSLRSLVADRLQRRNITNEEDLVNTQIRELFIDIEEIIRYRYVKYMTIYNNVLAAVMIKKGLKESSENLVPIHLFLEFGASSRTMINLISLGLSRTSAIILRDKVRFREDLEIDRCIQYIEAVDLDHSELPVICKAEIRRIRRAHSA